jgi:large subunit ribosomal protein L13
MPITHTTRSLSTETARASRRWFVADAEDQVLGRLASHVASVLRGKTRASYTPHVDAGDFVVVVNAAKIRLTGAKTSQKQYIRHSGYPGGVHRARADEVLQKQPTRVSKAVVGMLPKNRLGRRLATSSRCTRGRSIRTAAQRPSPLPAVGREGAATETVSTTGSDACGARRWRRAGARWWSTAPPTFARANRG